MTFKNYRTTSAGIAAIAAGVSGVIFAIKKKELNEAVVTGSVTSLLTGVGLLFARDAQVSSVDMGLEGVTTTSKGDHVVSFIGPKEEAAKLLAESKERKSEY